MSPPVSLFHEAMLMQEWKKIGKRVGRPGFYRMLSFTAIAAMAFSISFLSSNTMVSARSLPRGFPLQKFSFSSLEMLLALIASSALCGK
jgi:hypothetical protein